MFDLDKTLRINMFGTISLTYGEKQIGCDSNRSKLIWNILSYLISHRGKLVPSQELINAVWDVSKNQNPAGAMRTAIHRARQMLCELTDDEDCSLLLSQNGGYMWNTAYDIKVDTDEFEKLVTKISEGAEDLETCLAAIEMYQGKFLAMQSSEMWVMPIQAYYHNLYESVLDITIPQLEKPGMWEQGVDICHKALQIDPYSERFYQHLMRLLLVADARQEVVRMYESMSKILLTTFGVMPDAESRALYREALLSVKNSGVVTWDALADQLCEKEEITTALVCDYDFFKVLYQAHARAIVRNGTVIHTALITLKGRKGHEVSPRSISVAMDNLERHMANSLRKGDIIARCSSSQFVIMLLSADYENSNKVCRRVIASFEKKYPHTPVTVDHFVKALIPSTKS